MLYLHFVKSWSTESFPKEEIVVVNCMCLLEDAIFNNKRCISHVT